MIKKSVWGIYRKYKRKNNPNRRIVTFNPKNENKGKLEKLDRNVLMIITFAILMIGIYPNFIIQSFKVDVERIGTLK